MQSRRIKTKTKFPTLWRKKTCNINPRKPDWECVCAGIIYRWYREKLDKAKENEEESPFPKHVADQFELPSLASYFGVDQATVSRQRACIEDFLISTHSERMRSLDKHWTLVP
jgi:hypothetical protein